MTLAVQEQPTHPSPARVPDPRDGAIRAAERATYTYYGLETTERYVRVDAGCGHVEVRITEFAADPGADESQVPVVMLHGIGSATVLGASLVRHLRGRRVIAVDWPGHGLSGPCILPPTLGIRTHATTTIASLLDELGLDRVDLVGHSLGAQFTLYAAHDLGSRVRRIFLLGAPGAAILGVKPVTVMKLLATPGLGRALLSAPMSQRAFHRNQDLTLGPGALDDSPPKLVEAGLPARRPGEQRSEHRVVLPSPDPPGRGAPWSRAAAGPGPDRPAGPVRLGRPGRVPPPRRRRPRSSRSATPGCSGSPPPATPRGSRPTGRWVPRSPTTSAGPSGERPWA